MRGKAVSFPNILTRCRITPAYAGKRYAGCDFGNVQRDHPRLCGEKLLSIFQKSNHLGSPPPMRGKVKFFHFFFLRDRITPAYAGKSGGTGGGRGLRWDHPRLCGEKRQQSQPLRQAWGSPPPMRGKVVFHMKFVQHHRITPAYAGKSFATISSDAPFRDHPRLCGEKRC